jgi:hypothetical protein
VGALVVPLVSALAAPACSGKGAGPSTSSGASGSSSGSTGSSSSGDGGVPDPRWSCIGAVKPLPSGGMVTVKVQLVDLATQAPIAQNLTIALCATNDATCASPLGTPTPDAMGIVNATVASDFAGYLDVVDTTGNHPESLVFLDLEDVAKIPTVALLEKTAEQQLAATLMVNLDPTGAIVFVSTRDCTGALAAGVTTILTPGATETGFYVVGGAASATATATDATGSAGFLNVMAPGQVTLSGTLGPAGEEFGRVTTLVRPGVATYPILRPTPSP